MEKKYLDVYTLYKLQCSDGDILKAYYPFLANIILEEGMEVIDENIVKENFENKYEIPISQQFVRQVLGRGVENSSIVNQHGKYIADRKELKKYALPSSDFDVLWRRFKKKFNQYCKIQQLDLVSDEKFENLVFSLLDTHSLKFIIDNDWTGDENVENLDYYWYSFIQKLPEVDPELLNFLAYLSASNIYREALFVTEQEKIQFENLNVYLDSPMVFALLGMDSSERCSAYKNLLGDIQKAGCNVYILDNNYEEVQGILERASGWADSSGYDISKANKVAKFFHDSTMSRPEMVEYCESLEEKLNDLGIRIKQTSYNTLDNSFQEDEVELSKMIKEKYRDHNMTLSPEKEESINCDVKSIIMVYRERKGKVSTRIQSCSELMLTLNAALANVCKTYEQTKSLMRGHIPACVSADLFGSILWLNSPIESVEYQKKKILADCYSALRPNHELLKKYVESIDSAWKTGEIDEKKYLFMRTHAVVSDALMNVTKGDYARFNDHTYNEVFEEIEAIARKELYDEKSAHENTKEELLETQKGKKELEEMLLDLQKKFDDYKNDQNEKDKNRFDKECHRLGVILSYAIFLIPYFFVYVLGEFLKSRLTNRLTIRSLIIITLIVVITFIMGICRKKIESFYTRKMHKWLKK